MRMIPDDIREQMVESTSRAIRTKYQIGRPYEYDIARIALETMLPLIEVHYEQQMSTIWDAAYYLAFGPGAMSNPVIAALNEIRESRDND